MSAMTNLAQETRLIGGGLGSLPHVNLLPPEIAAEARFRNIQVGLGGLVFLAAAGVGLLVFNAHNAVGTAQDHLTTATAEQTTLQAETAKFADVTATYAKADNAQVLLTAAMGDEVRYSRLLNDLGLSIPDNVWIKTATYTQAVTPTPVGSTTPAIGTVTFTGVAQKHNDVAAWLDALAQQKGFADPQLQSSTEVLIGDVVVVNWNATVNITDAALSGRFTKAAGG